MKRLAQDLKVLKTLEVRVSTLSLGSVVLTQRDRNINVLRRFSKDLKIHEFLPVDAAVPFFRDADIMDTCELRVYENIPAGEYVFCPFETADQPSPAQLLARTVLNFAWVIAASREFTAHAHQIALCACPLRPASQNQVGAFASMDNRRWLVFEFGPASWVGTRKQENVVNTMHCWRVSGDVSKSNQLVTEQRRHATSHGVRVEDVQVTKEILRFKPAGMKEKMFMGWTGWSDADFGLRIGDMDAKRGVFALRADMSGTYCSHGSDTGMASLPRRNCLRMLGCDV